MVWRNTINQWGLISIFFHWLSAVTVISLFLLGMWMVDLTYYDDWYRRAPHIHKSIGILLFVLTLLRLLWLGLTMKPAALTAHTKTEHQLAKIMYWILYLFLFSLMLSGYFISTADGRVIAVFNWLEIPAIVSGIEGQEDIAGKIHFILALSLMTAVSAHALAAIKHHFINKDKTLTRMFGHP